MSGNSSCPQCGTTLPENAPGGLCPKCLLNAGFPSEPAGGFVPPQPTELNQHDLFPDLEFLELLGKGGMGAVYRVRQKRLDRIVAVKILPPAVGDDPAFAARFTREAKTLARLNHPNIVQVYDFGQSGPYFYFIMEYVDGVSLRQTILSGGLEPQQAMTIIPRICEALQFAHDAGVVHRDIKPENVLIDSRGRVRIADFGLAMLLNREPADITLTAVNQVMGTPHYMAPEQMKGSPSIDHRADIYSLGVVFYELLTGELPIGHFEKPSHRLHLDVRLDEVVLRALAAEPDRRYQHASDIQHDVESISASVSVSPGGQACSVRKQSAATAETVIDTNPDHAPGTNWGTRQTLLVLSANLWFVMAVVLLVGRRVARTSPLMYSFFDIGGWVDPATYNIWIAGCLVIAGGFALGLRRGRHRSRSSAQPGPPLRVRPDAKVSRKAVVGAAFGGFLFIGLFGALPGWVVTTRTVSHSESHLAEGSAPLGQAAAVQQETELTAEKRDSMMGTAIQYVAVFVLLPLVLTSPFVTMILGGLAISNIRHSDGRLTGLPLAIFDLLVFPLLILNGLQCWIITSLLEATFGMGMEALFLVPLCLVACIATDVWIGRRVWRHMNVQPLAQTSGR
ncbi:MAG: serine/threonine protein kinase [Planctomycetaceae bacterium]|nr:serine/threonine protein kinase [Planctomycetaceae bacterium]